VEKTVENVKTLAGFSKGDRGENPSFPPCYPFAGQNLGGKVDDLVENPQNGEFSTKHLSNVEFLGKTDRFLHIFC